MSVTRLSSSLPILAPTVFRKDAWIIAKKRSWKSFKSRSPPLCLVRMDGFIIFQRLSKQALRDMTDVRLNRIQARLDDEDMLLQADDAVRDWLCEHSSDPRFGVADNDELFDSQVQDPIDDMILNGEITAGQTIRVTVLDTRITLTIASATNAPAADITPPAATPAAPPTAPIAVAIAPPVVTTVCRHNNLLAIALHHLSNDTLRARLQARIVNKRALARPKDGHMLLSSSTYKVSISVQRCIGCGRKHQKDFTLNTLKWWIF